MDAIHVQVSSDHTFFLVHGGVADFFFLFFAGVIHKKSLDRTQHLTDTTLTF